MSWIILALVAVAIAWLAERMRWAEPLRDARRLLQRIRWVVGSSVISDHWKEKAVLVYAGRMLRLSGVLLSRVLILASPVIVVALFPLPLFRRAASLMMEPLGMGFVTLVAAGVFWVRRRGSSRNEGKPSARAT
ncbi:MAG: hypothetical protein ACFB21_01950 [Opitutales bacterium]